MNLEAVWEPKPSRSRSRLGAMYMCRDVHLHTCVHAYMMECHELKVIGRNLPQCKVMKYDVR